MYIEGTRILGLNCINNYSINCEYECIVSIWIYKLSTWAENLCDRVGYIYRISTCHLHLDLELERFVGSYLNIVLVNILVNEFAQYAKYPCRNIHIHIHSWNRKFTTSKDTILATYGSASGNMSSLATLVSEADACVGINGVDEWLSREFIPASTRLYGIEYIWLYDGSLGAVNSRSNLSSLLLSLDLNIAIGVNSHIYSIDRSRSDEAIINPFIYTRTSRYREYHWKTHIEWALVCKECSHPCDRVSSIGKG